MTDASQIPHGATVPTDWDKPNENVGAKLDELASTRVTGPSSAVKDTRIAVFDGTTGKKIKDDGFVTIVSGKLSGGSIDDPMVSLGNVTQHVRPLCGLSYNDITARTADAWLRIGHTQMSSTEGFVMPYDGAIRAHSVSVDIQTATSGDVTFEVRINNSNQASLELQFTAAGGTGVKNGRVTVAAGAVTFSAGDIIQVRANEAIGIMGWDDVMGTIFVEFDP